jgi:hypothetical protein
MLLIDAVLMNADADGMLTRGKKKRREEGVRSLRSFARVLDFD